MSYRVCGLLLLLSVGCQSPIRRSETTSQNQFSYKEEHSCFGSPNARNHAVYLHGFTDNKFGASELRNLQNLKKLTKNYDLMIATPKSPKACLHKGDLKRCWGTDMTESEARDATVIAARAAAKCFPPQSSYGVIGFSNGGYVANKIFSYCLAPRISPRLKWIVTVGAAKLWGTGHSKTNLRSCRPITLVAGKNDKYNYERRQNKFRNMRKKGADISILLFDGGHEVPYGPLLTAIRKHLQ
jgi:predicted esterase